MLNFFRINDPYRLIGVFLIQILFRLPLWLSDIGITIPQLKWHIIANRLTEGALMYSGVWDNLSPFSAGTYWIIHWIFGDSYFVHQLLSLLLVFIQSAIFNTIIISKGAINENSYIPAVVYVILASLYFDFMVLSPVLMGLTFLLLALNNVFSQIEIRAKRDEKLLSTGLYLGIAALFHFPFIIYGFIILVVFILFTATVRRRYFLFIFGWSLPMVLTILYYFYHDSFGFYWTNHIRSWFVLRSNHYLSSNVALMIAGITGLFLLFALFRIFQKARLTNYQSRLVSAMFLILFLSGSIFFLEIDWNAYVLLSFIPPLAFLMSHYFSLSKRGFMSSLVFTIFIIIVGAFQIKSLVGSNKDGVFNMSKYFVKEDPELTRFNGKKILYLGDNIQVYHHAYAASPFINWRLSEKVWVESRRYRNLAIITHAFEHEKPEIIIDPNGLMMDFLDQAPAFESAYRKEGTLYYLVSGVNGVTGN